ncbi:uncharacterized protein N7515_004918 [Penicillium bovifimosum]|uniref:Uncharacterized protein n=1 Tax=Penicillium bovifimosum TaxID=126998 RepID=A0A9W9H155_9EURO|nr:uncharacterized protein N7515_004918 [Penicillium bovifimosum]KAJ5135640.1 hypothetical protein N7515_004918 [Penicillium bovifimosum]
MAFKFAYPSNMELIVIEGTPGEHEEAKMVSIHVDQAKMIASSGYFRSKLHIHRSKMWSFSFNMGKYFAGYLVALLATHRSGTEGLRRHLVCHGYRAALTRRGRLDLNEAWAVINWYRRLIQISTGSQAQ